MSYKLEPSVDVPFAIWAILKRTRRAQRNDLVIAHFPTRMRSRSCPCLWRKINCANYHLLVTTPKDPKHSARQVCPVTRNERDATLFLTTVPLLASKIALASCQGRYSTSNLSICGSLSPSPARQLFKVEKSIAEKTHAKKSRVSIVCDWKRWPHVFSGKLIPITIDTV